MNCRKGSLRFFPLVAVVLFVLGSCQPSDQAWSWGDAGMDAGTSVVASKQQALETSLCGSVSALQANAPWPMRGGCPTHAARSSEAGAATNTLNLERDTFGDVRGSAAIAADGTIYITGDDSLGLNGKLHKIAPSGALTSLTLGGKAQTTPAIAADGTVYVTSEAKRLAAIDPTTFAQKWAFPVGGIISSSPTLGLSGVVYFGSSDKKVYAVKPTGVKHWTNPYTTGGAVVSSPALSLDGATLFIGSDDKNLFALNASTGALKWKRLLPAAVKSSPAVGRFNRVYVSAGPKLYAIDATTGVIAWEKALGTGTVYSPAVAESGVIYVATASGATGALYALSPDGDILWQYGTLGGIESTPTIDRVGNLYFGANDASLYALSSAGKQIWKFQTLGPVRSSPAIARGGAIIVGSDDNKIYSVGVGNPLVPAGASCTSDLVCEPGLLCGVGNGARFGKPAGSNACWAPSCENKVKDPGETEVDCGGICGTCTAVCSQACTLGSQVTPPALETLSFAKGAFIRGSVTSYQTGANKLALARGDQLRYEDRGDGNGRVALFEGSRTNRIVWSEQLGHAPEWWSGVVSAPTMTLTEDATAAPDGTPTADRWVAEAAANGARAQTIVNAMPAGSLSAWLRLTNPASYNPASPLKTRAVMTDLTGGFYSEVLDWTLPAAWERRSLVTAVPTGSTAVQLSHKAGFPGTAAQFPALPAADFAVWGYQLEEGKFPSSYIPTQESAVTRRADLLLFETKDVPAWLRTGLWQFDTLALFSSAEIAVGEEFVLFAWEGGQISLGKDAAGGFVQLAAGTAVTKRTIAWNRNSKLTLTLNGTAKTLEVGGATSGNGSGAYASAIALAGTGRVSIGALINGTKPAFARISEPRRVASASVACVVDPDCVVCGDGIVTGAEACDTGATAWCAPDCSRESNPGVGAPGTACPPGQVLGLANGARYGLDPEENVCQPVVPCSTAPELACGTFYAPCGGCECQPSCTGKTCGDSLDDACGGKCPVSCEAGECGCEFDWQCPNGHRCLTGAGSRFGCSEPGAGVCAPSACDDAPEDKTQCGYAGAPCGQVCPPVAAACAGVECGRNELGQNCGTCAAGKLCGSGVCFDPVFQAHPDLSVPAPIPRLPPSDTAKVGAMAGDFDVDSNGQARYSVPIEVPPGYNGMEPRLRLAYSSGSGLGYMGLGWTISGRGLSIVHRCPKNYADDGEQSPPAYTSNDAFCLDGMRLIEVSRSANTVEYRTTPDSFAKIVAHNEPGVSGGPGRFVVYSKDGLIHEYGLEGPTCRDPSWSACSNSRLLLDNAPSTIVRAWALAKISDRAGNTISVQYTEPSLCTGSVGALCGTDEVRPRRITYSGGGWVSFEYQKQERPDPRDGFRNGTNTRKTRLLHKVVTGSFAGAHRSYWPQYAERDASGVPIPRHQPGVLSSLAVCGGDATTPSGLACLPASTFSYEKGTQGGFSRALKPVHNDDVVRYTILDGDGDGRKDLLLWLRGDRAVFYSKWAYTDSSQIERSFQAGLDIPNADLARWASTVVDIDNDGDDEVLAADESVEGRWPLYMHTAGSFVEYPSFPAEVGGFPIIFDADGDGWKDILTCEHVDGGSEWTYRRQFDLRFEAPIAFESSEHCPMAVAGRYSESWRTNPLTIDVDGDGSLDLLSDWAAEGEPYGFREWVFEYQHSDRSMRVRTLHVGDYRIHVENWGDFNGDGYPEPLGYVNTGSAGTRFVRAIAPAYCFRPITYHREPRPIVIGDYDADGRDDVICDDRVFRAFYDGSFQIEEKVAGVSDITVFSKLTLADFDGDGVQDLLQLYPNLNIHEGRSSLRKMNRIVDGLGNTVSVTYSHQDDTGATYSPGLSCSFPCGMGERPSSMVRQVSYSRADFEGRAVEYSYRGLHRDLQRNATIGFDRVVEREGMRWKITEFDHRYDYLGGYIGKPQHRGSFLFASKPARQVEFAVVSGSDLTGLSQELWGEVREWGWNRETSTAGLPFPYARTFQRSSLSGAPVALGAASPVADMTLAQLGAELTLVVSRNDSADGFGNRIQSQTAWADGTYTFQAALFDVDTTAWSVSRKAREAFMWAQPRPDQPYLITYRRAAFEHDERGFLDAITREPPVHAWELAVFGTSAAQVMEQNRREHELRTQFETDPHGRVFRRDSISASEVRSSYLEFSPDALHPMATASVDEAGMRTTLDVDRNSGQLRYVRYPDGSATQYGYDGLDRLVESRDRDGRTVITLAAGSPGRTLVDGESPIQVDTRYTVSQREPNGRVTFTGFNGHNQAVLEVFFTASGALANVERIYDANGNLTRESVAHESTLAAPATTSFRYDELNRLREVIAPGPNQTLRVATRKYAHPNALLRAGEGWVTSQLDDASVVVAGEDPAGRQSGNVVGLRGQTLAAVEPEDLRTDYSYGPFDIATGTSISSRGSRKAWTARVSTVYGWPTLVSDSSTGTHRYSYNRFGDLIGHVDAESRATSWTYDALGRPLTRTNSDGVSTWDWDCRRAPNGACLRPGSEGYGKVAWTRSEDGHETEFTYDPTHRRLSGETYRIQTPSGTRNLQLDYGYSAVGDLEYLAYPDTGFGRVVAQYQYAAGEIMAASYLRGTTQTSLWSRGPEKFGQRDTSNFGNGVRTLREYDRRTGELSTLASWHSNNPVNIDRVAAGDFNSVLLSRWDLGYNANGDLERRKELNAAEVQISYDAHGRIERETRVGQGGSAQLLDSYTYDPLGNLTSKSGVGSYEYEPGRPYVVKRAGQNQYQHDLNGSQTFRGGPQVQGGEQRLTYTANNKLRSLAIGSASPERYGYLADGTRAVTLNSAGHTAHAGRLFEVAQDGSGVTYRHRFLVEGAPVAELDLRGSGTDLRYFHLDWRASPTLISGSSGQVITRPRYDSFGAARAANASGVGFTSHRATEQSGLIDMGGRYYDPLLGRFVSADPYVPAPGYSQAYNRYAYVYNNPHSLIDPSGFSACDTNPSTGETKCWDEEGNEYTPPPDDEFDMDFDPGEGMAQANDIESERFDSSSSLMGGAGVPGSLSFGERLGWTAAGLGTGAAMTVGTGYLLGGMALICPLCTVGAGGLLLVTAGYQLLDGGFRDLVNSGGRVLDGSGSAEDHFNVALAAGAMLRMPRVPSALKQGGKDMALRLRLGIRNGGGASKGTRGVKAVGPGAHAVESIPARGPARDFTRAEREAVNRIGEKYGCHTCGAPTPGTKRADWVLDHQPPNAFNTSGGPQYLFPQCLNCSRIQGGEVGSLLP